MIDVHQVLIDELPVAVDVNHRLDPEPAVALAQPAEFLIEMRHRFCKRLDLRIEADEDPTFPGIHFERLESAVGGVEALSFLHVGCADQLALQVVEPAVIGATEFLEVAFA